MLLHTGANVNTQGGYHGNALQVSARYGRVNLVRSIVAGALPDRASRAPSPLGLNTSASPASSMTKLLDCEQLLSSFSLVHQIK
jgi:hypothetical protein